MFNLITFGFLAGVWPVTSPFFAHELEAHSRALALMNGAAECLHERFDLGEDDRRQGWLGEDGRKGFALL